MQDKYGLGYFCRRETGIAPRSLALWPLAHQPYGKQQAQIRSKWIRPALVRGEGQPTQGHIYDLPSPTDE